MPDRSPASIWLRPERSGRGPAPAFDRDRLASAGVAVADERGLAAVTMRAVAQELGSAPASLYRYVATRDELIELMTDRVYGEISYDGLGTGRWLDDLLVLCRGVRGVYHRHPWLLDATASGMPAGPRAAVFLEHALAAVAEVPVSARDKLEAVGVMNTVVASLSRTELAQRRAGRTMPQWQRAHEEYLARLTEAGGHPHVAAALAEPAAGGEGGEPAERLFDRLLGRVLTGLFQPGV
ncbi:TetR/AcrR family transcriptional regulator [Streptomyces sp. 7-21]|uniref:TetR/AcrR family transcriptional regulator n=1 Tax=Streptomyces sp. 7-21 TaxID=2802283 RepID=UPI00191EA185|nr:TetR/AcrR family transcriptional regulator [Streptomyces sp. 7-21]MBL1066847.1 TetR/AcrR family transcriptional regulator [Streptomyces sp. 7-21]